MLVQVVQVLPGIQVLGWDTRNRETRWDDQGREGLLSTCIGG